MTLPAEKLQEIFNAIPSWTELNERTLLSHLACQVPANGMILEIGALYGGVTAVLAMSNQFATVNVIDNFSWQPEGYPAPSKKLLLENTARLGLNNIFVYDATSAEVSHKWDKLIDFLWIDGGHSFDYVYFDLSYFSSFAKVIALHDYDNPGWPDIRQAVEKFLADKPNWYIDVVVGMVVVLRKEE